MAVRGFLGSHQLEALDILSSLWSQPIPKTAFGGHRIGFVWTMNPWQAWQNIIYIWVGNCVGNLYFSPFFFVDPFFLHVSLAMCSILELKAAISMAFATFRSSNLGVCKVLVLQLFMSHGILQLLVGFIKGWFRVYLGLVLALLTI